LATLSTQDHAAARSRRRDPVYAWKGETLEETGGPPNGPGLADAAPTYNMILDDGGDATPLVTREVDGSRGRTEVVQDFPAARVRGVPDRDETMTRSLEADPQRWTNKSPHDPRRHEEDDDRPYAALQAGRDGELAVPGDNVNDRSTSRSSTPVRLPALVVDGIKRVPTDDDRRTRSP